MKKGVTLSILTITVIIMITIATTATVIGTNVMQTAAYEEFLSKINRIYDDVNKYVVDNNRLPTTNEIVSKEGLPEELKSELVVNNDVDNNLYVVDMTKLNVENVNIGTGNIQNMDVFIVAENTNNVYYLKGVKYKGNEYYGMQLVIGQKEENTINETTLPTATITLSGTTATTESKVTAEIIQKDTDSGIDISKCRWIYTTTSDELGTDSTKYTGTFTSVIETITLNTNTSGDNYLHVLIVDKAGNKKEIISEKVVVTDTTAPRATIKLIATQAEIGEGITAKVTQTDVGSGIDVVNCKWEYTTISTSLGTNASAYTGSFTLAEETLTLTAEEVGEYYLHVLTTDKAGNKVEIISNKVVVSVGINGWRKKGIKVVNGEQELEIGDLVDYTATGTDYDGDWKVLGADDDGNLLIMSASDVNNKSLSANISMENRQYTWLNGAAELDALCEPYGSGESAIHARSITIEDIDSITGFDKTTYGKGEIDQYGNEVTYLYNGTTNPTYYSEVTGEREMSYHSSGFYYYDYDLKKFVHITAEKLESGEKGEEITKLTSNYYKYGVDDVELTEKVELMLFGGYNVEWNEYKAWYWLASTFVLVSDNNVHFGMYYVDIGDINDNLLWNLDGPNVDTDEAGVRAVVTLSSDITFTEYTEDGWSY